MDRLIVVLLVMTAATEIVHAVSYLALGHVFTANMTGNVALMAFGLGGASGISVSRSGIALFCFMLGAVAGGNNPHWGRRSAAIVSMLAGAAAGAALLRFSLAAPLLLCDGIALVCAFSKFDSAPV